MCVFLYTLQHVCIIVYSMYVEANVPTTYHTQHHAPPPPSLNTPTHQTQNHSVHGMKSGRMLKEFRGHTSYVNHVGYTADGTQVLSASSDATVRVWDSKSCECVHAFRPPQAPGATDVPVNKVMVHPQNNAHLIVCNKSSTLYIMTMQVGGWWERDVVWVWVWC